MIMKRNHNDEDTGHLIRPPGWSESAARRNSSEGSDDDTPPAKRILKSLLENEVKKAIRELNEEAPTLIRTKEHRAASLIPEFDPDSEDCTVTAWLRKIEQLGEIHGWDEKTKAFHLQDKLRGQARKWYNRLEDYDYSWYDWKQMLIRAFPKHRDYGNLLEEMMHRKKMPTETMTKYYQDKVAMCFRCKLSDAATVSCIIRGLPSTLQPNARAYQCERPDELYEGFLCALDDYRPPAPEARALNKDIRQSFEKRNTQINPDIDPCPRCKKTGHILRNCSQPDLRTCFKCGKQGHIATRCTITSKPPSSEANQNVKEIKVLQNYNDIYKKVVKVNGIFVKSYLDTGSQVNVLNSQVSRLLSLEVIPTSVILKGFSGGFITSRGEVEFQLEIDTISVRYKAYLTDIEMGGINLLIGQPVINGDGISLIVGNGTATLQQDTDFTKQMNVVEECSRFQVVTTTKECLPPGTSVIKVNVLGNKEDNEVVTSPRHFELGGVSYSLPATLLRGDAGYIKVINTGTGNAVWQQGEVITRADTCEAPPPSEVQVSRQAIPILPLPLPLPLSLPTSTILNTSLATNCTIIGGVNVDNIRFGPLNEKERNDLIDLLCKYGDCFASSTRELGCTNLLEMKIKLTTDQPVYRQPYRLSHKEQEIVRSKVTELLDAGIIKESSPITLHLLFLLKRKMATVDFAWIIGRLTQLQLRIDTRCPI